MLKMNAQSPLHRACLKPAGLFIPAALGLKWMGWVFVFGGKAEITPWGKHQPDGNHSDDAKLQDKQTPPLRENWVPWSSHGLTS